MRIKEVKEIKTISGNINKKILREVFNTLKKQKQEALKDRNKHIAFFEIYKIIALYTTFIKDEPIHPVGMPFPGGLKIKYENGNYLCPVKDSQKDNPHAVCGFCIVQQG